MRINMHKERLALRQLIIKFQTQITIVDRKTILTIQILKAFIKKKIKTRNSLH